MRSEVIVDGTSGCVYINPDRSIRQEYERLQGEFDQKQRALEGIRDLPAETTDGCRIAMLANIGLVSDLRVAHLHGAEGVGLYRTEFPFMARSSFPGRLEQAASQAANQGRSQADQMQTLQQDPSQGMQMGMQMASQLGSTLGQLPQQLMQGVTQPFQQLTQPLQQVSSLFGQMGGMTGGDKGAQVGMLGATPFSNHPAIGGSGAGAGSGMVRAASLPGAGGTSARTPLMSNLVGKELQPTMSAVAVGAGAAAGAVASGLAPVGGSGSGGGPMGMMGQRGKSGGNRAALNAPAPLEHDLNEDEEDDW